MAKLRDAFSKAHLKRLGQDVEPPTAKEAETAQRVLKRRAYAAGDRPGLAKAGRARSSAHEPANENGGAKAALEEPGPIREARGRLRAMVKVATKGAPKPSIGIVLAILTQETGNHVAANALIDEYELEKNFGIKKFTNT